MQLGLTCTDRPPASSRTMNNVQIGSTWCTPHTDNIHNRDYLELSAKLHYHDIYYNDYYSIFNHRMFACRSAITRSPRYLHHRSVYLHFNSSIHSISFIFHSVQSLSSSDPMERLSLNHELVQSLQPTAYRRRRRSGG